MPPRALAVTLPIASAAWLALFLPGCAGTPDPASPPAAAQRAGETVALRYVTHRVHPANDFKRVSEYFTGRENTGGDIIRRTDSRDRRGLYFMVALDHFDSLPAGAVAVLEFVAADKPEPRKHLFVLPPVAPSDLFREIRLGVTGADWPAADPAVIAWKITLRDPRSGAVIAADQSFLWDLPAAK